MKNKWRILKILVTVILFGFLLSFSLQRFSDAPMEQVSVNLVELQESEKVYFIDEKEIRNLIKKSNPTKKIGDIDIPALEKKISRLPSIDSANVYLNLNGRLNVDIVQRVPVFRLNKNGNDFYVDRKGNEFPVSRIYSHPCMLVTGNVKKEEYIPLAELIDKINQDPFSKKYFIGISKVKKDYNLLTSEGNFKVEIGNLENIEFKVKGFKTFAEKFLVFQDQNKYNKVSVKYDNQIVTTLNPQYEGNDSILTVRKKQLAKIPELAERKQEMIRKKTE
ncbi:cell division protein FtsQ/DivIB [Chryseobacterium lacus]|uniref:cell division protein FtsQ/DivIB n=1 Tax=Chryseobacterium lacus TaxID=2058346 RepID=UPI001E5399A8|nr:cell division protein FtsQ [Chryseobacterium lacus]